MGGRRQLTRPIAVAVLVLLGACSEDGDTGIGTSGIDTSGVGTAVTETAASTVADATRPVPTVAPSTIPGQSGTTEPGVVNASPTIVPAPPPSIDPDEPATTPPPPTTDLVGDPQPNPNTTLPPPPPTVEAPPSTCDRLAAFDVASIVGDAGGTDATVEVVSDTVCRYTSGTVVAEVHVVPESDITDDWNRRSGIEPVGEVSGDAVGFGSFLAPGAPEADGYTIALASGRTGVVVAVRGTDDARFVAGQVAIFANQAA